MEYMPFTLQAILSGTCCITVSTAVCQGMRQVAFGAAGRGKGVTNPKPSTTPRAIQCSISRRCTRPGKLTAEAVHRDP
jgi:hypothetical protein